MQSAEVHTWINAPSEEVYALVSDITRMGEYSPECYRCWWIQGATGPAVGARFRGSNKWKGLKWTRTVEVVAAEPGKEFDFRTLPGGIYRDSTA